MDDSLHPIDGIRLLLQCQRVDDDGAGAVYRAAIYTPDECFEYEARLNLQGQARLQPDPGGATEELETKLLNIAKSTARAAKRKLDEELPPWPSRVLRWRGPGRG